MLGQREEDWQCKRKTFELRQKNVPVAVEAVDIWTSENRWSEHQYPDGCSQTAGESAEVGSIYSPISTYAEEMALKFLTGEESLDNFDAFIARLDSMNLKRYLEIQQAAYGSLYNPVKVAKSRQHCCRTLLAL